MAEAKADRPANLAAARSAAAAEEVAAWAAKGELVAIPSPPFRSDGIDRARSLSVRSLLPACGDLGFW